MDTLILINRDPTVDAIERGNWRDKLDIATITHGRMESSLGHKWAAPDERHRDGCWDLVGSGCYRRRRHTA